eukprot:6200003-Pleurochrysis_carterae.AAC.2
MTLRTTLPVPVAPSLCSPPPHPPDRPSALFQFPPFPLHYLFISASSSSAFSRTCSDPCEPCQWVHAASR